MRGGRSISIILSAHLFPRREFKFNGHLLNALIIVSTIIGLSLKSKINEILSLRVDAVTAVISLYRENSGAILHPIYVANPVAHFTPKNK